MDIGCNCFVDTFPLAWLSDHLKSLSIVGSEVATEAPGRIDHAYSLFQFHIVFSVRGVISLHTIGGVDLDD